MAVFTYKEAVTTVPSLLALQYTVKIACVFLTHLLFLAQMQEGTAFLSQDEPAARAWKVMQDPIRIQVASNSVPQDPCGPH